MRLTLRAVLTLVLAATLVAAAVFLLVNPQAVREMVVFPVQYVAWLGGLMLRSIDQVYLWVGLLILAAGVALRSLSVRPPAAPWTASSLAGRRKPGSGGRAGHWADLLERSAHGQFSLNFTRREIRKLAVAVLADQMHLHPVLLDRRLREGAIVPPPELAAILLAREGQAGAGRGCLGGLSSLLSSLLAPWRAGRRGPSGRAEFDEELQRALRYLEDQLEIPHEHPHP